MATELLEQVVASLSDPPSLQVGNTTELVDFSIFSTVPRELRDQLVAAACQDRKASCLDTNDSSHSNRAHQVDRAVGSMVGMAVTDAFGHWFEFLPAVPSLPSLATPAACCGPENVSKGRQGVFKRTWFLTRKILGFGAAGRGSVPTAEQYIQSSARAVD